MTGDGAMKGETDMRARTRDQMGGADRRNHVTDDVFCGNWMTAEQASNAQTMQPSDSYIRPLFAGLSMFSPHLARGVSAY